MERGRGSGVDVPPYVDGRIAEGKRALHVDGLRDCMSPDIQDGKKRVNALTSPPG
jgi:hypothetical protein